MSEFKQVADRSSVLHSNVFVERYDRLVVLFIVATIGSEVYLNVRGDSLVFLIGNFNLWASDLAAVCGVPMFLLAARNVSLPLNTTRFITLVWISIVGLWLLRAAAISTFEGFYFSRSYAVYWLGLATFALRPISSDLMRKIFRLLVFGGGALTILAVLRHLLGMGLFMATNTATFLQVLNDPRPISASGALIMGETILLAIGLRNREGSHTGLTPLAAIFICAILVLGLLLSGQRTVAAATVCGGAMMGLMGAWKRIKDYFNVYGLFVIVAAFALILAFDPDWLIAMLPSSFLKGSAIDDMYLRYLIWLSIVKSFVTWSLFSQLFGKADPWNLFWYFGSAIGTGERVDTRSPHNEYFGALLYCGALGLSLIFAMIGFAIRDGINAVKRAVTTNNSGLSFATLVALMSVLLVYGISYEWQHAQAIFVGLCIAGYETAASKEEVS